MGKGFMKLFLITIIVFFFSGCLIKDVLETENPITVDNGDLWDEGKNKLLESNFPESYLDKVPEEFVIGSVNSGEIYATEQIVNEDGSSLISLHSAMELQEYNDEYFQKKAEEKMKKYTEYLKANTEIPDEFSSLAKEKNIKTKGFANLEDTYFIEDLDGGKVSIKMFSYIDGYATSSTTSVYYPEVKSVVLLEWLDMPSYQGVDVLNLWNSDLFIKEAFASTYLEYYREHVIVYPDEWGISMKYQNEPVDTEYFQSIFEESIPPYEIEKSGSSSLESNGNLLRTGFYKGGSMIALKLDTLDSHSQSFLTYKTAKDIYDKYDYFMQGIEGVQTLSVLKKASAVMYIKGDTDVSLDNLNTAVLPTFDMFHQINSTFILGIKPGFEKQYIPIQKKHELRLIGFRGGNGSKEKPYMINEVQQLAAMHGDLEANYILVGDIDLNGMEWIPIGTSSNPFRGSFDGNGYKIKNFKVSKSTNSDSGDGLFGNTSNAILQNIIIENDDLTDAQ